MYHVVTVDSINLLDHHQEGVNHVKREGDSKKQKNRGKKRRVVFSDWDQADHPETVMKVVVTRVVKVEDRPYPRRSTRVRRAPMHRCVGCMCASSTNFDDMPPLERVFFKK